MHDVVVLPRNVNAWFHYLLFQIKVLLKIHRVVTIYEYVPGVPADWAAIQKALQTGKWGRVEIFLETQRGRKLGMSIITEGTETSAIADTASLQSWEDSETRLIKVILVS